ncbi:hypothetical protein I5M27_03235 [Adhaeribacter sp. BT258]|uniref:Orphan protein n=1 Tax=Adhaeribacter terrigena TaxID=2793070 RepID=A0ABS1BXV3_9BACT|nr:DUF6702 family protein [Adhaeribacter terrigena]MBK0401982.1 hypothetical protein [Adhaeribacter terrigena]
MKLKIWRNILLLVCLLAIFQKAEAHPYHVSIAEVKYNAKTQSLEIALKIFTDDLEKTLSDLVRKPVLLTSDAAVQKLLETYFQKNFNVALSHNQVEVPRLLGFEKQDDAHWFYLDIPVKASQLVTAKLRNQVLIQTFPDQTNLTNLEINGQKRTLIFKEGEVLKPLL